MSSRKERNILTSGGELLFWGKDFKTVKESNKIMVIKPRNNISLTALASKLGTKCFSIVTRESTFAYINIRSRQPDWKKNFQITLQ